MGCPVCGGEMERGSLGGTGLSWVPEGKPPRRTLFLNYLRRGRFFGVERWPYWTAVAVRCPSCDVVLASTLRGRTGQKLRV